MPNKSGDSSLHDWFTKSKSSDGKPGWVQLGGKYAGKPCAKQPGQTTKPKCGSSKMKRNLDDEEEQKAFERKNRQDPNPDRRGKAKNVATEEKQTIRYCPKCKKNETRSECAFGPKYWDDYSKPAIEEAAGEKDACYKKVKSRYKVWPSAYASGALVKCRKKGAANWGNKTEEYQFSNWRDDFKAMEYEFIDLIKPEPLVSEASFEINKTAHNKEKRAAKIRTLSTQGSTEGEREAAQNKTKGPKLFGEACKTKKHGGDSAKPGPNKNYVKPSGDLEEAVRMPAKNGNIIFAMVSWRGRVYSLQMFFPAGKRPSRQEVQDQVRKVYPDSKLTYFNVRDYEPGQPLLQVEEAKVDKDKMKCNEPKAQAVGDSLTGKSHVVKACSGGEEKIIRFGQRGVKGSPKKEGESEAYAARRNAFKDRHAKNIAKGKMSAAYWANKVKW